MLSGMGPFTLSPDQPQDILIGIITSFGADNLDSVRKLKQDDRFIQRLADQGLLDPRPVEGPGLPDVFEFAASLYPTPAADALTLQYGVPQEMEVRIEVFDLLGRSRAILVDGVQAADLT